ncbi:hypothetical protein FA95DRAFT_956484 [Auriscalpium vulgare]|uniref:Uncharacterized protein n=1 Tax=Auriscalpium vulgare TaxID=40419 RepID=A0ACB8R7F0_9AGAM|nr:hypothetical protein FA95DRAFT_956484 [Auriscalpium vulgare]
MKAWRVLSSRLVLSGSIELCVYDACIDGAASYFCSSSDILPSLFENYSSLNIFAYSHSVHTLEQMTTQSLGRFCRAFTQSTLVESTLRYKKL